MKISTYVAIISWTSWFALLWLRILDTTEPTKMVTFAYFLFIIIALVASAISSGYRKEKP